MNHSQAYQQEQEALRQAAPTLFAIAKTEVFSVPQGYFELLREESTGRSKLPPVERGETSGFEVPDAYFKEQSQALMNITGTESPMHATAQDEEHLLTPAGYFSELEEAILSRTTRAPQTKVIGMVRPKTRRWLYTISSAAAILIAVAAILLAQGAEEDCKTFACLLEQTELTHDELLEFYVDSDLEETWAPEDDEPVLSDEELTEYLDDDLEWITDTEME
jgi:hypothetical protein